MENGRKGTVHGGKKQKKRGKSSLEKAGENVSEETGKLVLKGLNKRKREGSTNDLGPGDVDGKSQEGRSQEMDAGGAKKKKRKRRKESGASTSGEGHESTGDVVSVSPNQKSGSKVRVEREKNEAVEEKGRSPGKAKRKKKKKKRAIQKVGSDGGGDEESNRRGEAIGRRSLEGKGEVAPNLEGRPAGTAAKAPVTAGGDKAPQKSAPRQSSLLDKMRARLQGGHFRMLNERLYTSRGADAFASFQRDPAQFQNYHRGYQEQMAHWPKLPVQVVGEWLRARGPDLRVADFGCGDARLAASVKNKVFSLDLVAAHPGVIACNMAHTPLESASVDVAVFCLSLMGTDYGSFLEEAHRVLVSGGWLLIAEVKSRFDPQNGGADPRAFVGALKKLGFQMVRQDDSNKMFMWWEFQKGGPERPGKKEGAVIWPPLKACIYKRR